MLYLYRIAIYGLLGWALDTAFRSLLAGAYQPGTWLPYFSLVYPTGAFVALYAHSHLLCHRPIYIQYLGQSFAATMVEYISGLFGIQFLHRQLWDYSSSSLNLHGLIDIWHAAIWGVLALLLVHWIDPYLVRLIHRR